MSVGDVILGKRLSSRREHAERVGPLAGIPVLGLDALASAAYGPEAALTVLLPLGAGAAPHLPWLMLPIMVLLLLVGMSYGQTVTAYPGGGGAYTVAKENLGTPAGLLAGAALALDYILNVAVAISAGVGALVSVVPSLLPHTLALCLGILLLMTLVNLRGVRDVGTAWMLPTYAFVGGVLAVLAIGVVRALGSGLHPQPMVPPPAAGAPVAAASVWLLVRAFASGCTAMTGVEAVSNSVPIFRDPTVQNARRALATIVGLLIVMLAGIALLCPIYGVNATPPGRAGYQSVLSQLFGAIVGRGVQYHFVMATVLAVLALSANTSFAAFPRLCRVLALDGFLPEEFAHRGRRLVYTRGVVLLALVSGVLLLAFNGVTDRLIPLFAIGALAAFTLSQAAMVMHWCRKHGARWRRSLLLNGVGALATGATLLVVGVSKFAEGAWVSLLIVFAFVTLFWRVRRYQQHLEAQLGRVERVDFDPAASPLVIVPLRRLDRVAGKALRFATQLSRDVEVVQIRSNDEAAGDDLRVRWADLVEHPAERAGIRVPRLVTLASEYREFVGPVVDHILRRAGAGREVVVVVPEIVPRRWYHYLLQSHHATLLKALLLLRGGPRVVVANTPWYVQDVPGQERAASQRT